MSSSGLGYGASGLLPFSDADQSYRANFDLIVAEYLKKRGYAQAEKALRSEARLLQPEELARSSHASGFSTAGSHSILFFDADTNTEPSVYYSSYSSLRKWIRSSTLELYRCELTPLLYPLFVHSYLDLVRRNFSVEAQRFMNKFGRDHADSHSEELRHFASLLRAHQVTQDELCSQWRSNQYRVNVSREAFHLLVGFIESTDNICALALINQFVSVRVYAAYPHSTHQYDVVSGLIDADQRPCVMAANFTQPPPLSWGLLRDDVEYIHQLHKLREREELERKALAGLPDPSARAAQRPSRDAGAAVEAVDSKIPLPKLSSEAKAQLFSDIRHRVALSAAALPSVAMLTFCNTHESLCTIAVSEDASVVAAGFSDSAIRIWNLKQQYDQQQQQQQSDASSNAEAYTTLIGHSGPVYSLSFSPDNRFLISGSQDSTVRLWSVATGANLVCCRSHTFSVWSVQFSPLGYYFASGSHDRTARLWATDQVHPLRVFVGHLSDVDCVQFHPNCNYLATGSSDKTVRLWEVHSGECVRIFLGHVGFVSTVAFSPDGRLLASASSDKTIQLWDLADASSVAQLYAHRKTIWTLAFSREGSILASGSADRTVRLWNVKKARSDNDAHASGADSAKAISRKRKSTSCPYLLESFPTKATPVILVQFTRRNLLLAAGNFQSKA